MRDDLEKNIVERVFGNNPDTYLFNKGLFSHRHKAVGYIAETLVELEFMPDNSVKAYFRRYGEDMEGRVTEVLSDITGDKLLFFGRKTDVRSEKRNKDGFYYSSVFHESSDKLVVRFDNKPILS